MTENACAYRARSLRYKRAALDSMGVDHIWSRKEARAYANISSV